MAWDTKKIILNLIGGLIIATIIFLLYKLVLGTVSVSLPIYFSLVAIGIFIFLKIVFGEVIGADKFVLNIVFLLIIGGTLFYLPKLHLFSALPIFSSFGTDFAANVDTTIQAGVGWIGFLQAHAGTMILIGLAIWLFNKPITKTIKELS